jgi:hypothetical protein
MRRSPSQRKFFANAHFLFNASYLCGFNAWALNCGPWVRIPSHRNRQAVATTHTCKHNKWRYTKMSKKRPIQGRIVASHRGLEVPRAQLPNFNDLYSYTHIYKRTYILVRSEGQRLAYPQSGNHQMCGLAKSPEKEPMVNFKMQGLYIKNLIISHIKQNPLWYRQHPRTQPTRAEC